MNKLSKIFLVIIIILTIALGVMTYYYVQMRQAYLGAANQMYDMIKTIEETEK